MKKMIFNLVMMMVMGVTSAANNAHTIVNEKAVMETSCNNEETAQSEGMTYDAQFGDNKLEDINGTNVVGRVVANNGVDATIRHEWITAKGTTATIEVSLPVDAYIGYASKKRENNINKWVNTYIYESYNDKLIDVIVQGLRNVQSANNLTNDELAVEAINFVQQSIVYQTDIQAKGVNEYPKYPIETFVDGAGDCEDQAMLLSAILRKLGYGTILIELPGHVAVGIKSDYNIGGSFYRYNGTKYYYIETTGTGWAIGSIPDQYRGVTARLFTVL